MPMQLRNRTLVPPPSSASRSSVGSVEMDAPAGTSTGNGERLGALGHSAKSHSSSQDDADETGHRSRSADVGNSGHSRSNADVASVSRGVTPEDGDVAQDDIVVSHLAAFQDGGEMSEAAFHDGHLDPQGFSTPKRTSRASSVRSASPPLASSAQFFGQWFSQDETAGASALPLDTDGVSVPQDWADSTDADGLGEIPADWIKQEPVSVELHWSPPASNDIDFSFDNLMREISASMTPQEKEQMLRRNANMRNARLRPADSVSNTTTATKSTKASIHAAHVNHATGSVYTSRSSRTANSTPRIPAAAKGKGRDFTTAPSIDYNDDYVSEEEAAADADRLHQLHADALLAMRLDKEINSEGPREEVPYVPAVGTSKMGATSQAPASEQVNKDHEIAQNLQKMFDDQYERLRALESRREDARESGNNPTHGRDSAGRKDNARARPTPMEQVPKSSVLFQEVDAEKKSEASGSKAKYTAKPKARSSPPPSDDISSSSSSDSDSSDSLPEFLKKVRKPQKKSKKGKKGKKSRRSKRKSRSKGSPPSSDDSSSDSDSSSSSGGFDSDWSSLGSAPSEVYSDDSPRTKRAKKRAKKNWQMKLLRLRLEQSNAKPDPPFVYGGEPRFSRIERWIYEARDWTKESYIRPNMRVSRVSKYLEGRALQCVGDITPRALIVQFWDGADFEMRRRWAHDGFDPETSTLNELENAAINYEHAIKVEKAQRPGGAQGKKSEQANTSNKPPQKPDRNPRGPRQEGGSKPGGARKDSYAKGSRSDSAQDARSQKGNRDGKPKNGGNKSHRLSREQMNEYRAQGKCFTCANTGHLSKDCPMNNDLKPPKQRMGAAAVSFEEIERLRNLKEAQKLGVFAVSIENVQVTPEHKQAIDEVLVARMRSDLRAELPFVFDYFGDAEDDPLREDRFQFVPTELGWLVCDRHTNDHHEVLRSQLLDPDFDFVFYIYNEKWAVEDLLCTANHPTRVTKRQDQERARNELIRDLPQMVPLSRCESPELPDWIDPRFRRDDLPHTLRMYMHRLGRVPDIPEEAENVIQGLEREFLAATPYSFDTPPLSNAERRSLYGWQRFTVEYSEHDFLLVTDRHHKRVYELTYARLLMQPWDARAWLELAHAALTRQLEAADVEELDDEWTEYTSDTESSWSSCGFTFSDSDSPPPPPPPPPASGAAAATIDESESDSSSESDEFPGLEPVSESESESEAEMGDETDSESGFDSDEIPDLQSVADTESESGADDEGSDSSDSDSDDDSDGDLSFVIRTGETDTEDIPDASEARDSDDSDDESERCNDAPDGDYCLDCATVEYCPACKEIHARRTRRIHSVQICAATPSKARKNNGQDTIAYQRNASRVRDFSRLVPRPMVITGKEVFAGLDLLPEVPKNEISAAATAPAAKKLRKGAVKPLPKVILRVRNPANGEFFTPGSNLEGGTLRDTEQPKKDIEKSGEPQTTIETLPAPKASTSRPAAEASSAKTMDPGTSKMTGPTEPNEVTQVQTPEEELLASVAPRLTDLISQGDPSVDLPQSLKNRYADDPFFKLVLADPGHYKNFEIANGLIFLKDGEALRAVRAAS
ncbi:hypothetical protein FB451DRAFT_1375898 [Mycena latifolia]|nr:hypothetical protein FB451DRAFT_1375898 [Mycena latifolia]